MRSSIVVLVILAGCGASAPPTDTPDAGPGSDDEPLAPPEHGFQIVTPTIDIRPGDEVTYCYYFRTPNTSDVAVQRWASRMTTGSHHMILYLTPSDQQAPGTLSTAQCGFANGAIGAAWTYSAQTANAEAVMPRDDGFGVPVAQPIKAGQSGFIQMHYLNASDDVIHARVTLNAHAYEDGTRVTPAAPYVTFNNRIDIAPGSKANPTMGMVNGNCPVLQGSSGEQPKFYVMSTHSHKQSVHTFVKDGAAMVFESNNWDHPGARAWDGTPYFSFSSGSLTYQCEYMNPNNYRIQDGDSAATDEMCMAVGYYFPAAESRGHLCINSTLIY